MMKTLCIWIMALFVCAMPALAQSVPDWQITRGVIDCTADKTLTVEGRKFHLVIKLPALTLWGSLTIIDTDITANGAVVIDGLEAGPITLASAIQKDANNLASATIPISRDRLEALFAAKDVSIKGLSSQTLTLKPAASAEAIKAMMQCSNDIVQALHLNSSIITAVKTGAAPGSQPFLSSTDLPRHGGGGVATILWTIGTDLHAHDCRVISASGNPELGPILCRAVEAHANYSKPALDAQGSPVPQYFVRQVRANL